MKILVTGAAGFIGSHLAERLCGRGDDVVGLDNFNDYYDPRKKRANQARLDQYDNFRMIEADIRDRPTIRNVFAEEKIDRVAHLAGMPGVRNAIQQPELYVNVNVNGSQNLMDAAREFPVSNFVFASTSTVYDNKDGTPLVETDRCDHPLQPYAAAKRAVEILGYSYSFLYQLNFTVVRFFSVYGPRNRPDMMPYLVAESICKGTPVYLHDGGQMYRAWTFVDDIVDGIARALDHPCGYEVYNLGRDEPVLLRNFIALLEAYAGQRANLIDVPKPGADMTEIRADISKARRVLGYEPKVKVEDGIQRFWDWYVSDANQI